MNDCNFRFFVLVGRNGDFKLILIVFVFFGLLVGFYLKHEE